MILRILFINSILLLFTYSALANNYDKTVIKIINKVSGKSYTQEIYQDQVFNFRNIAISSSQCISDKKGTNNFAAFVFLKKMNQEKYIFKGWLLSKNISLSQVSHPVYNIKLLKCLYKIN